VHEGRSQHVVPGRSTGATHRPSVEEGPGERHASWLELFFDLVLVAAVAALATQLHADHSVVGLAVFAGLLVPVWWAWMGFTWYATGFDGDDPVFRLGVLAGMLAIAVASAGVAGRQAGTPERSSSPTHASSMFLPPSMRVPGYGSQRPDR
jgi:low temperature requirement protein LtrA